MIEKQKIIFLASYANSLLNFRLHLIKEFIKKGYEVVTIAPHDDNVSSELARLNVKFIPLPMHRNGSNPIKDIMLIRQLYNILRNEQPDIIFSYTIKPVIYGSIAAKIAGVAQIYSMITGTGYVFSDGNLKSKIIAYIAKKLFKGSLKFNTKLFFQNKDNMHTFLNNQLIKPTLPMTVVNGSGVDITHFSPVAFPPKISFLMIARLLHDKGIREYFEAAEVIKKKYPHVCFRLVGATDSNPNSISQNELNLWIERGVIEYLGQLSDVRPAIANSSIYVLPSYAEGTPRSVLEAMAMGRPIITTDVPGCRETVLHGQNGLLVTVKDITSLCNAMEYFINDPAVISKMGKASREMAECKYDVNTVNAHIMSEMRLKVN